MIGLLSSTSFYENLNGPHTILGTAIKSNNYTLNNIINTCAYKKTIKSTKKINNTVSYKKYSK